MNEIRTLAQQVAANLDDEARWDLAQQRLALADPEPYPWADDAE